MFSWVAFLVPFTVLGSVLRGGRVVDVLRMGVLLPLSSAHWGRERGRKFQSVRFGV